MSNSNVRPFSLSEAIAGHPLVCRNGKPAKFIAYVAEANDWCQMVILMDGVTATRYKDGKQLGLSGESNGDMFLAPLGQCEGKNVFAGDVLLDSKGREFTAPLNGSYSEHIPYNLGSWPCPKCVVETRMTFVELATKYEEHYSFREVANKAIERAIKDGDVIPAVVVEELFIRAKAKSDEYCSAEYHFRALLKEYKESLK